MSRVKPASVIQPLSMSPFRFLSVSEAQPEHLLVPHASEYEYYDDVVDRPVTALSDSWAAPPRCSYGELVKGHGQLIEQWVRGSQHTSNEILAGQVYCPQGMTLDEFRAFGNLRSGTAFQWANILCQLSMPSLDLNKISTFALMMQAALEAGPDTGTGLPCGYNHSDTQNPVFMSQMIQALSNTLERVQESWENHDTLALLASLTTRLLVLSPSDEISLRLLKYLSEVRRVSVRWARAIMEKLSRSSDDQETKDLSELLLMTALICMATFHMDQSHLSSVLADPVELSFFVESAVLARNHLPGLGVPSDPMTLQLFYRWHTTMRESRVILMREVLNGGNNGLDCALKKLWAGYSPSGSGWQPLGVAAQSHIFESRGSQCWVSFNLLTCSLFVDGYPLLANLPWTYRQHKVFGELFGDQVLHVGPSSDPTMTFSACRDQSGWVVHFI